MSNSINVIFPYRHEDIWMFDDESIGLVREPFVSGVPHLSIFPKLLKKFIARQNHEDNYL
jgi:hypothetical protein